MADKKPTRKRGASLSISSIDPLVKIEYARLAVIADMTQAEFTRTLLSNYKCFNLDFSKEEQERLEVALQKTPSSLKNKIKRSILRHVESAINRPSKVINNDINARTSSHSANARVDALLGQILKHNEIVDNWYDKIFITKSSMQSYVQQQKGLNTSCLTPGKTVIDRCLERNKELIATHHLEQGLDSSHNSKAYYARSKKHKFN
jgi:hypothetical protein